MSFGRGHALNIETVDGSGLHVDLVGAQERGMGYV